MSFPLPPPDGGAAGSGFSPAPGFAVTTLKGRLGGEGFSDRSSRSGSASSSSRGSSTGAGFGSFFATGAGSRLGGGAGSFFGGGALGSGLAAVPPRGVGLLGSGLAGSGLRAAGSERPAGFAAGFAAPP